MSASLVGSEMCIRDSLCAAHARACMRAACGSASSMLRRPSEPADTAQTVSYTHLTLPTICSV
eukprot:5820231-Alexandrium_andersonii.AAC.1